MPANISTNTPQPPQQRLSPNDVETDNVQGNNQEIYQPQTTTKDFSRQIDFVARIMSNILSSKQKRLMIGGDTGLGKTSFVQQLCRMLGIPSIVVEIPHTVEEQLINIPFITYDQAGRPAAQGAETIDAEKGKVVKPYQTQSSETRLVLAKSHLVHVLENLHKVPDAQYGNWIKTKLTADEQEFLRQFEEEHPGLISDARNELDNVLFFDEYYRTTTAAIRNILRGVLDRRIGNDPLPRGTYVMYASNINDVSGTIDQVSSHTSASFDTEDFRAPTKEQWLNYTISSAINKGVKFRKDVVDVFNKIVADYHLSYNDIATEIRTSPRRWSEILLYINNSYPFKSPTDVGIITTVLKKQFQNNEPENNTSQLYSVVEEILMELAKRSNIDPRSVTPVSPTEWRQVLAHQILSQQEIGGSKKYVPVVQGLPGIGKTSIGAIFENPPYNMRFIVVDSTTLSRDSVVGIPLPVKSNDTMGVDFAEPELSVFIKNQIAEKEQAYYQKLKTQEQSGELNGQTADQVYSAYQAQKYKYVIFFDEINRVSSPAIFNSLRRLILEKKFNHLHKLPDESIIVGAMNPVDLGTQPLSSHFRDAIDLIDTAPKWSDTIGFIKTQVVPFIKQKYKPTQEVIQLALNIVEGFPEAFADKKKESGEFYINLGNIEVYFSPRDYDDLFRGLAFEINRAFISMENKLNKGIEVEPINSKIVEIAYEKFYSSFRTIFYKEEISAGGFMNHVKNYLSTIVNESLTQKTSNISLGDILADVIQGSSIDQFEFDNYLKRYGTVPTAIRKDIDQFLIKYFGNVNEENLLQKTKVLINMIEEFKIATSETIAEYSSLLDQMENSLEEFIADRNKKAMSTSKDKPATATIFAKAFQQIMDALDKN